MIQAEEEAVRLEEGRNCHLLVTCNGSGELEEEMVVQMASKAVTATPTPLQI